METPKPVKTSAAQLRASASYAFRRKYPGRSLAEWQERCRAVDGKCAICRRTPEESAGQGVRPRGLSPFGAGFLPVCASCLAQFAWLKRRGHTAESDAFLVDGLQLVRPVWVAIRLASEPAAGSILETLHGARIPYPVRSFQWTGAPDAGPMPRLSDYLRPVQAEPDAAAVVPVVPDPIPGPAAPENPPARPASALDRWANPPK